MGCSNFQALIVLNILIIVRTKFWSNSEPKSAQTSCDCNSRRSTQIPEKIKVFLNSIFIFDIWLQNCKINFQSHLVNYTVLPMDYRIF